MQYPPESILLDLYRRMMLVRRFEETVQRIYREGRMPGFVHLYIGEEAIVAGVTARLSKEDSISSTHRGHAHAVGKGIPLSSLMAELFGRQDGLCGGRGGSMHFFSKEYNFLGCNGIVGYGVPIAAGAAYAAKYLGTGQIAVAFFGDGAVNLGVFHEVMNMAAIWKLPMIFVNENNLYATELPFTYAVAGGSVAARAAGYGIPGVEVDGQDVLAVYDAASEAIARARNGEGPSLLECRTYRFVGHHEGDPGTGYRTQAEVELWKQRDPIHLFHQKLLEHKLVSESALDQLKEQIESEIAQAVKFGESSPWPSIETVGNKVFFTAL